MTMIYIENLSDNANLAQTQALFERFGTIASIRMKPGGSGHRFDGFGLVEMGEAAARQAIAELDGLLFYGTILSVQEATEAQSRNTESVLPGSPIEDEESPRAIMQRRYEVAEVEKVDGPGGADGDDWYRYVLTRGSSRITCFHRGTQAEVTDYATECEDAFNERNRRGKATHPLAMRRKR